jgi:Holliday junction resolvase
MHSKVKGYRIERKIRILFEKSGWKVIRAGASLGEADLICIKNKKCVLIQVKSTNKKTFYFYDNTFKTIEGFPLFLVVDFGYNKIRILPPQKKVLPTDGEPLKSFLIKQ